MRDPQEELLKKLDEVVGTEFDERGKRWGAAWLRHSLRRWIAGIVVAIGMVALVWWILDSHLKAAHRKADAQRPVVIDLLPAR